MLKNFFFILIVIAGEFILSGAEGKQSHAQPSKIDSLLSLLKKDKEDTNKVNHLNDLGWEMKYSNPDTAIILSNQALAIATVIAGNEVTKQSDRKFIANSLGNLGAYYWLQGDYPKA